MAANNENSIKELANNALSEIRHAISSQITETEVKEISKIIEDKLVKAIIQSSKSCTSTAVICCGPESDLAHKISTEVKTTQNALIANLKSMR